MKTIKIGIVILLTIILSVNAIEVFDKECKKDGSLSITLKADSKAITYTGDVQVKAAETPIKGTWDTLEILKSETTRREFSTFTSEENILTAKRSYPINIEYKTTEGNGSKTTGTKSFEVECPGLLFSCNGLNMSIESCENQEGGLFRAVVNAQGLEQSPAATMDILQVVDFVLEAENKYKDMTGKETTRGTLPAKSQVLRIQKDKYVIRYEFSSKNNNTIKTLWAGFNKNMNYDCNEKEYPDVKFYDKIECKAGEAAEEPKKEIETEKEVVEEENKEKTAENKKTAEDILKVAPKNYKPLAIVSIILIVVLSIGGIVLSYLYKRGYL